MTRDLFIGGERRIELARAVALLDPQLCLIRFISIGATPGAAAMIPGARTD